MLKTTIIFKKHMRRKNKILDKVFVYIDNFITFITLVKKSKTYLYSYQFYYFSEWMLTSNAMKTVYAAFLTICINIGEFLKFLFEVELNLMGVKNNCDIFST